MSKTHGDGAGESFGPYAVYECLGVGGMASVHRAVKRGIEDFERVVALKRLLPHLAEDQNFVQSFVREARLASKLQHANIIQLYDLGRVDRVYYIAMEYVRGRDLRKILKQTAYATGPMPVAMMLALAQQLCDALDYAHSLRDEDDQPLGIIHRDISPSNLLVAADGHLKVIDFGIARATAASLRTSSGRVKGKFAYMAPEAIIGQPLDHRSDIFSAGIVAHEMLTARPLFACKNEYDTLQKIANEPVAPPSTRNPDCPPELDEIVLTALAKSPEERWQSAGAMHQALDHVIKKHSLRASPREIAEWVRWAFAQPLQRQRVKHRGLRQRLKDRFTTGEQTTNPKKPSLRSSTGPIDVAALDKASIEIVWGGRGSQGHAGQAAQPGPEGAGRGSGPSRATSPARPRATSAAAGRDNPPAQPSRPHEVNLPAWAAGTPQYDAGSPVTSSHRVTMLGLAPPPAVEKLRAERAGSASDTLPDGARPPLPAADAASGPDSRETTFEFKRDAVLSVVADEDSDDERVTLERNRPSALSPAGASPGDDTVVESPAQIRAASFYQPLPARAPDAGVISRQAGTARPYNPEDELGELEVPRKLSYKIIRIGLLALLCVAAAIVGYLLVPGSSNESPPETRDDESQREPRPALAGDERAGDERAGDERAGDEPAGDEPAGDEPAVLAADAGAALQSRARDAGPPALVVLHRDGESPPVVASDQLERLSGEPPKVRASQRLDDRGDPVVIRAHLCIDDEGKVSRVDITDAPRALVKRSQKELKRWLYRPAVIDGQTAPVCFDIEISPRVE